MIITFDNQLYCLVGDSQRGCLLDYPQDTYDKVFAVIENSYLYKDGEKIGMWQNKSFQKIEDLPLKPMKPKPLKDIDKKFYEKYGYVPQDDQKDRLYKELQTNEKINKYFNSKKDESIWNS